MDDILPANNATETHWLQSSTHVNALFSAIAIGCLIGTVPLTAIVHAYGIRGLISLYGGASAIATLLFPLAVYIGYPAVFLVRVIQGISTSLSYPATGLISSQWATHKGTSTFIAILSCHMQFCAILTMPVAGGLCDTNFGWRSLYYLQGAMCLVAHVVFYFFYRDNPKKHRKAGPLEIERIRKGRENQGVEKKVPYLQILKDPCVLAIWSSLLGATLGFQMFLLYGPTYMNKVLGFDVTATGFATAIPYILAFLVKFVLGPLSDKLRNISNRLKMIFFATLSQFAMASCFIVLTLTSSATIAQIAYTASIVFSGVNCVGTVKCSSVVCRQHVHFVLSVVAFFQCLIVLLLPVAVDIVCPNNTPEEWSRLLLGVSVIVIAASVPFIFTATDQPAEWTRSRTKEKVPEEKEEKPESFEMFSKNVMVY